LKNRENNALSKSASSYKEKSPERLRIKKTVSHTDLRMNLSPMAPEEEGKPFFYKSDKKDQGQLMVPQPFVNKF
jgi:hypothetical protein